MLTAMFKHDFKRMARLLLPVQIAVVGGGILAGLLVLLMSSASGGASAVLSVLSAIVIFAIVAGVMACIVITIIIIGRRFMDSLYGSEGYLTNTLPVSAYENIGAKLISGSLWMMINAAAVILAVLLFLLIGVMPLGLFDFNTYIDFSIVNTLVFNDSLLTVMLGIVNSLAGVIFSVSILLCAVVIGGTIGRRRKTGCAVGMYFAITFVYSIVRTLINAIINQQLTLNLDKYSAYFNVSTIADIILALGLSAGMFFLSCSLLKNNLNLE